jgi:hypothetical protein
MSMVAAGLYACSSSDGDAIPDANNNGHPATPAGGEAGVDPPAQDAGKPPPVDPPPPAKCAILESKAGPVIEPAACKRCAAERCCGQLTKCHGASPADAGLDGSNGKKTACQLFGECEGNCNGDPVCEAQCGVTYGDRAADDWVSADGCLSDPAPAGCSDLCN